MALTQAGSDLTRLHRGQQQQLTRQVERMVRATWPLLDPGDLDATVRLWTTTLLPVVESGRQQSVSLSRAYLQSFALAETGAEAVIPELSGAPLKAAETSLRVTGPVTIKALVEQGIAVEPAARTALEMVVGSVQRHVLDGGRSMITASVAADPALSGWRRVGDGECKFCRMLLERGAVYAADTARFAAHDHCHCSAEPAYGGGPPASVEQYVASKRRITDADRTRVREYLAGMD